MKLFLILTLSLILSSCKTVQYVSYSDADIKQSIAVMTTYGTPNDLGYASELEKVLINMGISVIAPPAKIITRKSIENKNNDEELSSNDSDIKLDTEKEISGYFISVIELYKLYDKTSANYIITVDSKNKSFKIMKKRSKEIIAVLTNIKRPYFNREEIYETLKALGFKVINKT